VVDVERRATEGFLRGRTRFDGMDEYKGAVLELNFQNEWIVAWLDKKPIAMSPDLICVLDSVSGEAVGTETIRYGQRVTVIALPPPPVFLSPKGLQHVGRAPSGTTSTSRACSREFARHHRRRHQNRSPSALDPRHRRRRQSLPPATCALSTARAIACS
jgi:hypothetical protein